MAIQYTVPCTKTSTISGHKLEGPGYTVDCTLYIVQPQNGRKEEDLQPAIQSIIFHIFEKGGGQADR